MTQTWRHHPVVTGAGRLLLVVLFAALGLFLYALVFQLMVAAGLLVADLDGDGFGWALTRRAMLVWLAAIGLALAGSFVRAGWRWPLVLAPVYGPSVYAAMVVLAG